MWPRFTYPSPGADSFSLPSGNPNSHAAPKMWVGRGSQGSWVQALFTHLLGKAQVLVCFSLQGQGLGLGLGADSDATRGTGLPDHPHPARGFDRSLPLRPHYRGELPGLAEEPDGCKGGGEASLAPGPGLNIYYVLFGLWGKGGKGCRIELELRARPGRAQGRGRCPSPVTPEPPRAGRTEHPGAGTARCLTSGPR